MSELGVYVLTYPGDFHLSVALVKSLQHFNPELPITIIPGEGFDRNNHPFDVPIMLEPTDDWALLGHADRKFWAFQGPYEKFLYLDADIICIRSLAPFLKQLQEASGKFVFAEIQIDDDQWRSAVADPGHSLHKLCVDRVRGQLGNIELLKRFDPSYDPFVRYAFNSGAFASSRGTLVAKDFVELFRREEQFFLQELNKPFTWRAFDLFFGDQGRLNYLVAQRNISVYNLYPHGHYIWGGCAVKFPLTDVLAGRVEYSFIHWAGCPRPTPSWFSRGLLFPMVKLLNPALEPGYVRLGEIPGYSVWRYFTAQVAGTRFSLAEQWRWTRRDAQKIFKSVLRQGVARLKRAIA